MLTVKTFLRYEGRTREPLNLKAEILGMRGVIHHLDLTVKDPEQVFGFYDAVLSAQGYRLERKSERGFDWNLQSPLGEGGCRHSDPGSSYLSYPFINFSQ